MKLTFPASTDPEAAAALRYCHASFPTFPLSGETVELYLAELSKPHAAQAARDLADEGDFFPTRAQIRRRAERPPPPTERATPTPMRSEPELPRRFPPLGWASSVAAWVKSGARGAPPQIERTEEPNML